MSRSIFEINRSHRSTLWVLFSNVKQDKNCNVTIICSNHGRISVSNFVCGSDEFAFLMFFVLQISSCHRTFCAGPNLSNTIAKRSFVTLPSENPLRSVSTVFQNNGTFQVCLMLCVTKDIVC